MKKIQFSANKYHSDDDVIAVVDDFVDQMDGSLMSSGAQDLQLQWKMIVHRKQG